MTTPNQDAPDGAVTVGGGQWRYGQNISEKQSREMFELETPSNIVEAVALLPSLVAMIPNNSFRGWQKWLGRPDEDVESGAVKQALIDSLDKKPLRKLLNNLWNGLTGNSDEDDKTPEDVLAAAQSVRLSVEDANDGLLDVVTAGSNLVKNSDFERGVSKQPLQGVFSNDVAFSGTRSLKMVSEGAGKSYALLSEGLTPRTIPSSENDVYYVEVMVRGWEENVQATGGVDGIRLVVTPYSRTGAALPVTSEQYRALDATTALKNVWTKLSGYVYMPAGTARAGISLELTPAVANGSTFYFDSVIVREVTLAKRAEDAANEANDTANNANDTANNANDTANNANDTANNANDTANNANSNANTANTNAGAAITNANNAVGSVDEIIRSGSNLIRNGDFERGTASAGGTFVTTQAFSGSRSLRLVGPGTGISTSYELVTTGLTPQTLQAREGDVFYVEVYVRGDSANTQTSGGAEGIRMVLSPEARNGSMLPDHYVNLTASTALNGVWTKMYGYLTMPSDTVKVSVSLQLRQSKVNSGEVYYFDQAVCREVTVAVEAAEIGGDIVAAGSNLIKNADFERGLSSQPLQGTFSDEVPAFFGSRTLKMKSNGNGKDYELLATGLTPRTTPAKEGDAFEVEVMVWGAATNVQTSGGTNGIRLAIDPKDRFGAALTTQFKALDASTALNGKWTKLSGIIVMPVGTTRVRFSLQLSDDVADNETYHFDNVIVREVTLANTANSTANTAKADSAVAASNSSLALSNAISANDLAIQVEESGSNLITNGDFEKGLVSPQPLVASYSEEQAYTGTRSLKMEAGATKTFYLLSDGLTPRKIPASEGDVFYCEMYVHGYAVTNTTTDGLRIVLEPLNRFGFGLTDAYVGLTVSPSLNNTWTKVAAYATLPPGTKQFKVAVQLRNTVPNGIFHIDNVIVREVTLASTANAAAGTAQAAASTASTSASAAQTTANTATTNLQTTVDSVVQAVDGGTATGAAASTTKTKLQTAFARIFDGLQGNALNTSASKVSADMHSAGTALRSATTTAQTTATSANTAASTAQSAANTANSAAATADGKAVTAQTTANTATTNLQTTINGVAQAIDGGSAAYTAANVKTKMQLAWANLWDGMRGTSGATAKLPSDVKTEAAALKSKADSTETAAGAVTTNHNTLVTNVTQSFLGDSTLTGASLTQATTAMQKTYTDLAANTKAIQELQSARSASGSGGGSWSVNFADFASVTAAGFSLSYTGAGTSNTIVISNGDAQWSVADSVNPRDAKLIYSTPTLTDFQSVRGTMAAPPQVPSGTTPYFYAIARVSADGNSYVFARAYAQAFGNYKADIGYTTSGAAGEQIWVSGVQLSWSLDMRFVAGVGTNVREYQIWSGNSLVRSHTESGTASRLCSNAAHTTPSMHDTSCTKYRQWGAIAQVRNGKTAGKVSACSVSDNGTPSVNGSVARMVRTGTTAVTYAGGSTVTALPGSFFDSIPHESLDVDAVTSTGTFKVTAGKPYIISARVALANNVSALGTLILQRSTNNGTSWSDAQYGNSVYTNNSEPLIGNWVQYLNAGDMVRLAYVRGGINTNSLTGEATGAQTYFAIAGAEGAS